MVQAYTRSSPGLYVTVPAGGSAGGSVLLKAPSSALVGVQARQKNKTDF